jgi:mannose-1-phosphate guanylyltransferase/phosphomannomutase
MVPVLNRPMMAYTVELLKQHGITDIAVTLQYLPEAIRDYFGNGSEFGVHMKYFVEKSPLGTAGSVKNAAAFLDDTFVVISGDALTDFDLARAIDFHRESRSIATLVLARVDTPLEYGVVITDRAGSITQFLEKPSWGEVFSDTVNTGIYILEPEVLEYFEDGRMFDFSKDLFPLLLREGRALSGVVSDGYWCDIGNLQQYLQAHIDVLSGKVNIKVSGRKLAGGVFAGQGVDIDPLAVIDGPAFIGDNCKIERQARIEPFSVLGDNCYVGGRSTTKRSVIWNNTYIGRGAALRGAILCSRIQVQDGAGIYEGAVIGSDSVIKENGVVKPDVKIWPHKVIEAGTTVQSSIVWGTRCPKKIFGLDGVTGLANVEMTPEFAARIAASFATTAGGNGRLAVSSDSYPASQMIKKAVSSGMQSVGAAVFDLGEGITPMQRYAIKALELSGGIHVKVCPRMADLATMVFINEKGGNISRGAERKVENVMMRGDFKRADSSRIIPAQRIEGVAGRYIGELSASVNGNLFRDGAVRLTLAYDRVNLDKFIGPLCEQLGIEVKNIDFDIDGLTARSWQSYREMLPQLSEAVVKNGSTAGAVVDPNGDSLIILDERGRSVGDDMLMALYALVVLKDRGGTVVVPVTAPAVIEKMANRYNARVIRTKTAIQDFIEKVLAEESSRPAGGGVSQFLLNFDALGALLNIIGLARKWGMTLGQLVDEIPAFYVDKKAVSVPWEAKGTVIRRIIEEPGQAEMELLDGVKVYHPQGWALVLPDPEEPVCRIFSEGSSMEIAESLADFYVEKIGRIAGDR